MHGDSQAVALSARSVSRAPIVVVGADGRHYTMRRTYAPIHDELGDIFASVVIYHDVTEQAAARERIEAEVISRTAELAQRNEALELAKAAQELASARMELLLERLPSGVMLVSAEDMCITIINLLLGRNHVCFSCASQGSTPPSHLRTCPRGDDGPL